MILDGDKWADSEFSNVLDYLSSNNLSCNGSILLKWLASPYISLWFARSVKNQGEFIWIFHNMEFTDFVISCNKLTPRDVLVQFLLKWENRDFNTLRRRDVKKDLLLSNNLIEKHIEMLKNVTGDSALWQDVL